jgi:hypothetical protein
MLASRFVISLPRLAAERGYTLRRSRRKVPTLRRRRERWEVVELGAAFTDDASARAWLLKQDAISPPAKPAQTRAHMRKSETASAYQVAMF